MPVDNVAALEMDEKVLTEWKTAYKNCKKQRSVISKDSYDAFVSGIKTNYKNTVKKGLKNNDKTIDVETFENFFKDVVKKSDDYLRIGGTKEESIFYRKERRKAVTDLKTKSQEVLGELGEIKGIKEKGNNVDAEALKKYKIDVKKPIEPNTKIKNCLFSYVTDMYNFRIYAVVTSISKPVEGEFDFARCQINDTIKVDKDVKSRSIYLLTENDVNINTGLPWVGTLTYKVRIFVSPNWGLQVISDFLVGHKYIDIDGKALTKFVLD